MKKFILAAGIASFLAGTAFAADLPMKEAPPPPPSWTGFYIGANGGWGWATANTIATTFQPTGTLPNPVIPNQALSLSPSGAVFGGHLGYNWQVGPTWLVGVEGDFDGSNMSKTAARIAPDPLLGSGGLATDGFMQQTQVQWLASVRARLGWTIGPNLLYVTGGGAWEQVNNSVLLSADTMAAVYSTSATTSFTTTRSGWVAGFGYERMIAHDWIVRAEYLHYGFSGNATVSLPVTCTVFGAGASCGQSIATSNNNIDVVRVGLSYKFF